jgi:hypothetical protein
VTRDPDRTSFLSPGAVAGLLLMLPFALLELWQIGVSQRSVSTFPFPLFVVMWALPMFAVNAVAPTVRGSTRTSLPALRIACAALAAIAWVLLIADQFPCFIGVPNCD